MLLGFTLAAALLAGCAPSDQETEFLARKAFLQRQNQGMRELIAEAEQGTLVPRDRFLIGIDEQVIADVFRYQLPMERPSASGSSSASSRRRSSCATSTAPSPSRARSTARRPRSAGRGSASSAASAASRSIPGPTSST